MSFDLDQQADPALWMTATLNGVGFASEKWYVESTGRIVKTPL